MWVNRISSLKHEGEKDMLKLLALKDAYIKSEEGATAIEYGLIAAGISLAIVAVVFTFGEQLRDLFGGMEDSLGGALDNMNDNQ